MATVDVSIPKREIPKPSAGAGAWGWLAPFLLSTVGSKLTVAVTGLMLIGFVYFHMIGNLQIYAGLTFSNDPATVREATRHGQEILNRYAEFLKSEELLLWMARGGLLAVFLLHLVLTLRLRWLNAKARPVRYVYEKTIQATWASRHMALTGIVIGLFVLFHLAHYTLGVVKPAEVVVAGYYDPYLESPVVAPVEYRGQVVNPGDRIAVHYLDLRDYRGRHDVYTMATYGFGQNWQGYTISIIYIAAMIALFFHLRHGIHSVLQTLGIAHRKLYSMFALIALVLAAVVAIGNISMPIAIMLGLIRPGEVYLPAA
jgi:succinate dehydrogenase / fumarate reductase cytochrome b subunit